MYTGHGADVHLLLPFGDHIISVDRDSAVIVWDVESEGLCCKNNAELIIRIIVEFICFNEPRVEHVLVN